jgi:hypothetical protein
MSKRHARVSPPARVNRTPGKGQAARRIHSGASEGGVARASSEERIYYATSEWGGSPKGIGGRIHPEWRAPLHKKEEGAALPPRPTTVELVV